MNLWQPVLNNTTSTMRDIDNYFLAQNEPVKSCLLTLRDYILQFDPNISEDVLLSLGPQKISSAIFRNCRRVACTSSRITSGEKSANENYAV